MYIWSQNVVEGDLWIVDEAVAHVENGRVTILVNEPRRSLPAKAAYDVADKAWLKSRPVRLADARAKCETCDIPLTDRRSRSSLRLGGGFLITQEGPGHDKVVLIRRSMTAPRMPGVFCECGGIYEVRPGPDGRDYVAAMVREIPEVVITQGRTLYVPKLAAFSAGQGFQPPGALQDYNEILRQTTEEEARKAGVPFDTLCTFQVDIVADPEMCTLKFGYSPGLPVEVAFETQTSSLECVAALRLPAHLPKAQATVDPVWWDTEAKGDGEPLHREVHVIDVDTGEDCVWSGTPKGGRKCRQRNFRNVLTPAQKLGKQPKATGKVINMVERLFPGSTLAKLLK